ncbi:MAG: hypothetical protein ACLFU5_02100 [Thermoplasmata archaeon]
MNRVMMEEISESDLHVKTAEKSDEYTSVFFVFDSVLKNSEIQSQAALELFKNIQSQSLQ